MKTVSQANIKQSKAGLSILITVKEDLRTRDITRDREGDLVVVEGSMSG